MVYQTKEMLIPEPTLVPQYAGQWGQDDTEWKEEWGTRRRHYIMDWNDHVVAEGFEVDEFQLNRALRDEGVVPRR